jgi:hypothetical protein
MEAKVGVVAKYGIVGLVVLDYIVILERPIMLVSVVGVLAQIPDKPIMVMPEAARVFLRFIQVEGQEVIDLWLLALLVQRHMEQLVQVKVRLHGLEMAVSMALQFHSQK